MTSEMKLAEIFKDHMVLQRGQPIRLFGSGNGTAEAELNGETTRTTSSKDCWRLELPAMPAGGPYTLRVNLNGKDQIFRDVYIGDVWLAGGQSNMELPLRAAQHTEDDSKENPLIRYFTVTDGNEGNRAWVLGGPKTTPNFSAIGGRFAKRMAEQYSVPVGIISCNRGATCIESWTDKTYLLGTELELPSEQRFQDAVLYEKNGYGELYDLLVSRLIPYGMKGVLWYQGESNRGPYDGKIYGALLERLITCWRERFELPDLPFLIVQLTRYGEPDSEMVQWALIRQQQLEASQKISNVAMVTTTDLGQSEEIHPIRKKEVADRLVLAAQSLVFGEKVEYSGPLPSEATASDGEVVVSFTHAKGLNAQGPLDDIYCRTEDGRLLHTPAHLDGERLYITVPTGQRVQEIRAWYRNDAMVTLFNEAGFPASPFCMEVR